MNRIKSAERARMKDILNSLMLMYSMDKEEMRKIKRDKMKKMAETVAFKIWKKPGYRRDSYSSGDIPEI